MISQKCANGHEWSVEVGKSLDYGSPCDCGEKKYGVPIEKIREHKWQFYANGTFCTRCNAQLGSGYKCL